MPRNEVQTWKTYPPALIALACSLVLCCPLTSLLGVVVGWFSLRIIDASNGLYGGRRISLAAIILGLCMLPIQMILIQKYQQMSTDIIKADVARAVEIVFDVDDEDRDMALESAFLRHEGRYPDSGDADRFVRLVTERLGSFRSVSIVRLSTASDLSRPVHEVALFFDFENDTATGGAVCELQASIGSLIETRLVLLEISLPDGGVVRIPTSTDSDVGDERSEAADQGTSDGHPEGSIE